MIDNIKLTSRHNYPKGGRKEAALLNKEGERFDFILLTDRPNGRPDICADPHWLCHPEYSRNQTLPICEEYMEWDLN